MRAALRGLELEADPRTLPAEPEGFHFLLRLLIGPDNSEGRDVFDLVVCSPEWLSQKCEREGFFPGFHHLIVRPQDYDERRLRRFLENWVSRQEGSTWEEIALQLRLLGSWEFEGYRSAQ
jgi:Immunity protein 8